MEFAHDGNKLFVEENYAEACEQYTKAIAKLMGKEQFPALFGRARTLMYLDKHYNAIRDFGECLSLNHNHQLTNYYLGMCLMKSGKHDVEKIKQAHKYLLIAQNGSSKQNRFEKAVEKVIKLLQKLQPKIEISQEKQTKPIDHTDNDNDIEMKSNESEKPTTETTEAPKVAQLPETVKKETPKQNPKPKIRETWYQNATTITFILYAKKLSQEDVAIHFERKTVVIELKLKDGTIYRRNMQLRNEIKPQQTHYTMNAYKIIMTLIKETAGKWDVLESVISDGKFHSMIKKKDWDQLDKFAKQELEKEKPEGDEALQSLFSKIYGDADDDQRRAMVKSFQTSGGTVLSTNWKDVKDKDYEGKDKVLPTGQNTEKWEY